MFAGDVVKEIHHGQNKKYYNGLLAGKIGGVVEVLPIEDAAGGDRGGVRPAALELDVDVGDVARAGIPAALTDRAPPEAAALDGSEEGRIHDVADSDTGAGASDPDVDDGAASSSCNEDSRGDVLAVDEASTESHSANGEVTPLAFGVGLGDVDDLLLFRSDVGGVPPGQASIDLNQTNLKGRVHDGRSLQFKNV